MKFDYEERRAVAFIDKQGWLYIRSNHNTIAMKGDDIVLNPGFNEDTAVKKFYKGDKVTITF